METIIKPPTLKALAKNGWMVLKPHELYPVYVKEVSNHTVYIKGEDCWTKYPEYITPEDLIAIGNELKKLEEN